MPVPIQCSCGKTLTVADKYRGKKIKCPACGDPLAVEETRVQAEKPTKRSAAPRNDDDPVDINRLTSNKRKLLLWGGIGGGVLVLFSCLVCGGGGLWAYLAHAKAARAEQERLAKLEEERKAEDERLAAKAERRWNQRASINNLKQIGLAMHGFHDANKRLPAYAILSPPSPDIKPLLSWRVAILPYVDEIPLYNQIRMNEPWDSTHNRQFWNKMPKVYQLPGKPNDGKTYYQVFQSEPQPPEEASVFTLVDLRRTFVGITDGTSNTIFVAEAAEAVNWMKPQDIPFKVSAGGFPVTSLGNHWGDDTFQAAFGDATARRIRRTIPPRDLKALVTANGGEPIDFSQWEADN